MNRLETGSNWIRISYATRSGKGTFAVDLNQYIFGKEGVLEVRLLLSPKGSHGVRITSGKRLGALLDIVDMSDGGGVMTADEERIAHAQEIAELLTQAREHVRDYRDYLPEDDPDRALLTARIAKLDKLIDIMRKRYGRDVGLSPEAPADEERAQAVTLPVLVSTSELLPTDYEDAGTVGQPYTRGGLTVSAQERKGYLVTRGGVDYLIHHRTGKGGSWIVYVAAAGIRLPQAYHTREDAIAAVSRPGILRMTPQLANILRETRAALLAAVEFNPTITAKAREAIHALRVPEPPAASEAA